MGEVIVWWVVLELLGLAALPLAWVVMRRLPDRGYAFAKSLGLILVGYFMWLTSILQLASFNDGLGWTGLLALGGLSLWLLLRQERALATEIGAFFRRRIGYWLTVEVLFTVAFAAMALMKAYAPNIRITEQYMDFGFLNSIVKNEVMPPPDMWLAGWSINYYYLGYSLMGSLTKLAGVPTNIAYNLCMASLFAYTVAGSFGLVYNLVQGTLVGRARQSRRAVTGTLPRRRTQHAQERAAADAPPEQADELTPDDVVETQVTTTFAEGEAVEGPVRRRVALPPRPALSALLAGLLGSVLMAVIGNMVGAQQVLQQGKTAADFDYFWVMTRVIYDTASQYVITEFPLFSFLLNDMHPHVMALPGMLLALALGLSLLKLGAVGAVGRRHWLPDVGLSANTVEGRLRLLVTAVVLGMMYGLNTWDYPTFMLVVLACLAWPALAARANPRELTDAALDGTSVWRRLTSWTASRWGWWALQAGALVVLSLVLYLPFHLTFRSLVGSAASVIPAEVAGIPIIGGLMQRLSGFLSVNPYDKAGNLDGYLKIFGVFVFAMLGFLLLAAVRSFFEMLDAQRIDEDAAQADRRGRLIGFGVAAGVSVLALLLGFVTRFPLLALLVPMAAFALYLIRERLHPARWQSEEVFALTLIALGAVITLGTDIVYLRDVFENRMNTVFKFYYQTWVLWAIVGAYATWWLVGLPITRLLRARAAERESGGYAPRSLGDTLGLVTAPLWAIGMVVLIGLGLIYTVYGPQSKIRESYGAPGPEGYQLRGLDGVSYLPAADLAGIMWLRDQAAPGVVVEAPGGEYNVYSYAGRVSAVSGLPTLISWSGHESQWRGGQPEALGQLGQRRTDMDQIYASTDVTQTRQLMDKYDVRYVFIGSIEKGEVDADQNLRHAYGAGLTKFLQFMTPIYQQGGTTIYALPERNRPEPTRVVSGGAY